MSDDWQDINGNEATNYFFHDVIGTGTLEQDMRPSRMIIGNIFYLGLSWALVGACISFGIKWTGRIAYITMGLPVFMLFILLIRSLTLPGAKDGIHEFLGKWDMSILFERPDVWSTAVSQIFFSVGVAVSVKGYMSNSGALVHLFFLSFSRILVLSFVIVRSNDGFW